MLVARKENVAFRRNKRHGMAMSVVERYIRHDIPCAHSTCTQCPWNAELWRTGVPLLNGGVPFILVPDASVVSRYIELLEQQDALKNLVFCQTVIDALDRRNRTRTMRNVRRITADLRRSSVMFANEVFADTRASGEGRVSGESQAARDMRAVLQAARWYGQHMAAAQHHRVILLTIKDYSGIGALDSTATPAKVEVWQVADFIQQFHPALAEHLQAITDATHSSDLDITAQSPAEYARARLLSKGQTTYASYWLQSDIDDGLRTGALVRGKIRLLQSGGLRQEVKGVIERSGGLPDVVVTGRAALNRASMGDVVVVRLLTKAEERKAAEAADDNAGLDPRGDPHGSVAGMETEDCLSDDDDDKEEALAVEQVDAGDETPLSTASETVGGVVVGVVERKWRPYVATLQVDDPGSGSRHLAVPVDITVPKIRIHYMDTASIAGLYIVVAIDEWPADSQYPQGHFIRALGPVGDLDTEIDVILVERQIAVSQSALGFSTASLREMPIDSPLSPWMPAAEEVQKRRDLRDTLVFSIDPKGSQDIDDAVSMQRTDIGFELGVHIADVSQFVTPGSATDTEAQARGATVYLADRRFNMIPEVLSEQVCSLRGRKDRYAVSVIWQMDREYNVVDTWYGRTVIRSACEMYYEQAQALLDGQSGVEGLDSGMEETLRASILDLTTAMRVLRERRRQTGALELASTEVKFTFDKDTRAITELRPKASLEIHRVIEEAMVFANSAVARRIHQQFPNSALLRRHPAPSSERFERLVKAARTRGFEVDCSSNSALAMSLKKITEATSESDPDMVFLAKSMATLAMQEAVYFATGDRTEVEYAHYGLALEHYTHFTSPIRRYADVIVHRQLLNAVAMEQDASKDASPVESRQWVGDVAARLNELNRQSKFAQRESTELFQSRYVMQQTSSGQSYLVTEGVVSEIRTSGLIVYVPGFGIRGPVHLRDKSGQIKLPMSVLSGNSRDVDKLIEGCSDFSAEADRLSIRLPMNVPVFQLCGNVLRFSVFDHVRVCLRVLETKRRRPPIYLTLVSQATSSAGRRQAYRSNLPSLDKQFRISASLPRQMQAGSARIEEVQDGTVAEARADMNGHEVDAKDSSGKGNGSSGQKKQRKKKRIAEHYSILSKFSQMSLLESSCDIQSL
ncbi:RNB-domain-containing protein [Martensiomyces pterosporus]|nr:RNB-domain-containing protein [Martensiomyces pterosporus]